MKINLIPLFTPKNIIWNRYPNETKAYDQCYKPPKFVEIKRDVWNRQKRTYESGGRKIYNTSHPDLSKGEIPVILVDEYNDDTEKLLNWKYYNTWDAHENAMKNGDGYPITDADGIISTMREIVSPKKRRGD